MASYSVTEYDINLSVLQQKDPYIVGIVDTASQVAAYSFNSLTCEWEKTNIEGTLFVYTRSAVPTNGFMILNRLHLQDLIEPINKNLEFQLQDPFLLYKDSKNESICGIWFYDRDECARIGQLMNSLVQVARETHDQEQSRHRRASESDTSVVDRFVGGLGGGPMNSIQTSPQKHNIDILQLLSKAQDEYDKMSAKIHPTLNGDANSFPQIKHMKQLQHDSQSSSSTTNKQLHGNNNATYFKPEGFETVSFSQTQPASNVQHPTATHISLETLFKRASQHHRDKKLDQKFAAGGPNSAFHLPPPPLPTLATPTVEEIEKAHREGNLIKSKSGGILGSGGSAVVVSGGSSSNNEVVIRCGSDSSFSESSCEGISMNASRSKGKSESELDLKELHMQLMGHGHHQALESPNTALKRTLNIAPLPVSSAKLSDLPQHCSNEKPQLHSTRHHLPQQLNKNSSPNTTTNTLVQALFLREQHQQLQNMHISTSSISTQPQNIMSHSNSTPGTFSWIGKPVLPAVSVKSSLTSQVLPEIVPSASSSSSSSSVALKSTSQHAKDSPSKSIPNYKVNSPIKVIPTVPSTTQHVDAATPLTATTFQPVSQKQRQVSRPVSDMLSKPNNFLLNKDVGHSPVPTATLLSPMVFQSTRSGAQGQKSNQPSNLPNASQSSTLVNTLLAPLTTHQLHTSTVHNPPKETKKTDDSSDRKETEIKVTPLTKEQLKQALITLLENDVHFLTAIHEAYATSLNRGLTLHN